LPSRQIRIARQLGVLGREEDGRNVLFGRVPAAHDNVDEGGENSGHRDREQDGEVAEEDPDCELTTR
jgi:hypothetical protein